jgi:flagellar FliJ protein
MTRNLRRLQGIESLFASREETAGRELAQFEQVLKEAQSQLDVLRNYRASYLDGSPDRQPAHVTAMENQASFLRRLDEAIGRQQQVVERAALDRDQLRQRFNLCRRRTLAVGKAHTKRMAEHRTALDRQEQKEIDAWRRAPLDPES